MNRKLLIAGAAGLVALGVASFIRGVLPQDASTYIDPSDQALVTQGRQIYVQHCAACHGAKLEGQPNWRDRKANGRLPAPPHDETGHTWHHPDAVLIDITKNGLLPGTTAPTGYVSDMPAYGELLSDHDIIAVLAYIKSSWPAEALSAQKEVNQEHMAHRQP